MTPERLAEIRKRADAASPGPWTWILDGSISEIWDADDCVVADTDGHRSPDDDADFIAHAREDIPALLDEVERLTRAIESWKREEADWKERERELLEALFRAAPRRHYQSGSTGPPLLVAVFCSFCESELTSPDRPWDRYFGHAPDCIVKPAEKLMEQDRKE